MSEVVNYKSAPLPTTYESAKRALAECSRVDECKDWADKAIALSSYARQANDDELLKMANRIKARAVERMGQLFNQIEPQKGGDRRSTVAQPAVGREQAARDAGISQDQRKQAQAVASLDPDTFESAVESDDPPTITALAQMARRGDKNPKAMKATTQLLGMIKQFSAFCDAHPPESLIDSLAEHERSAVLKHSEVTINWLSNLAKEIGA